MEAKYKLIDVLVELHGLSRIQDFKNDIEKIALETIFSNESMIDMRIQRLKLVFLKHYEEASNKEIIPMMMKNYISMELDVKWGEEKEE